MSNFKGAGGFGWSGPISGGGNAANQAISAAAAANAVAAANRARSAAAAASAEAAANRAAVWSGVTGDAGNYDPWSGVTGDIYGAEGKSGDNQMSYSQFFGGNNQQQSTLPPSNPNPPSSVSPYLIVGVVALVAAFALRK